jgi:hypothetical protein
MIKSVVGLQGAGSHPLASSAQQDLRHIFQLYVDGLNPTDQADRLTVIQTLQAIAQIFNAAASKHCPKSPSLLRLECLGCQQRQPDHVADKEVLAALEAKRQELKEFVERAKSKK